MSGCKNEVRPIHRSWLVPAELRSEQGHETKLKYC
jgi:hypothetical protein